MARLRKPSPTLPISTNLLLLLIMMMMREQA
jgi:hypothetical protein